VDKMVRLILFFICIAISIAILLRVFDPLIEKAVDWLLAKRTKLKKIKVKKK